MPKKQPSPRRARHFLHKILNRITLTGLLLAVQLAWLCWFVFRLSQYAVGINILFTSLSLLLALYIVRREENPAYKISWIIVLCALPLFGLLIYGVFGNKHLSRRMRNKIEAVERAHPAPPPAHPPADLPPRFEATAAYLAHHGSYPAYANTDVTYYSLGDELFPALLTDLEKAKHYIFLEYFIIAEGTMLDKLLDVLARKASEGVDVRIIYDDIGCEAATPLSFVARAEKQGIRTLGFNRIIPFLSIVMNHRDHRKYTVIDGRVVYTGGINIADEYINEKVRFGHWKASLFPSRLSLTSLLSPYPNPSKTTRAPHNWPGVPTAPCSAGSPSTYFSCCFASVRGSWVIFPVEAGPLCPLPDLRKPPSPH